MPSLPTFLGYPPPYRFTGSSKIRDDSYYRFYEEGIKVMQNDTHRDAQTPNSATRDKAAGTMKEAGGHIKESVGALTGNKSMEAQGRKDQKAGAARRKKGTWKDRIKGWIDRR